ncbi:hypothetical protein T484DRAFT_3154683 [Baffinella frigidus]|nr:hypothetical protein T484DRAFT_3154683 [Cryptophyta sp. CCMP2293]
MLHSIHTLSLAKTKCKGQRQGHRETGVVSLARDCLPHRHVCTHVSSPSSLLPSIRWLYYHRYIGSLTGVVRAIDGEIHDIRRDFAGTRFERTGQPKPKGKAAAVAAAPRAQARSAARGQRGAQSARTSGASSPAALAPLAPEPGADSSPEAHAGSKRPLPEEEGRRSSGAFSEALGADGEEGDEGSVKSQDDILAGSKRPLPEEEGGEEEGDGTYSEPRGAAGRGGRVSGRPQKDGKEASGKGKGTQKKGKESKADKSAPKTLQIGDVVEVRFNDWFPGTLDKFVATQGWWKVVFEDGSPWFIKEVPGPVVRMLPLPGEEGRPPKPGDAVEVSPP